jgi:hypothetical protein
MVMYWSVYWNWQFLHDYERDYAQKHRFSAALAKLIAIGHWSYSAAAWTCRRKSYSISQYSGASVAKLFFAADAV